MQFSRLRSEVIKGTPMAIDSAYKTIQHAASLQDQNLEVAQDGVEQSRFGRPPSRPVGTEKDVKYEARPGMFGDNTPPEGNALISSLVERPIKNTLQELDENQLKKSRDNIHDDWKRTN